MREVALLSLVSLLVKLNVRRINAAHEYINDYSMNSLSCGRT